MAVVAKLKVTYTDGKEAVAVAGPRAQVACERHFKRPLSELLEAKMVEAFYFLAWAGLHFAAPESLEPRGFDDFLGVIADVEDAGEESEDPTKPAQ
jgi:hypothetical protein